MQIQQNDAPPYMIETYRGMVYPNQLDHMAHMNVQWYTAKFDEAGWQLAAAVGITPTYIREQQRGIAALEQTTQYKAELRAGDLLLVRSRALEMRGKIYRFMHIMYNAETQVEAARTELLTVQIARNTRKSCAFPEDIIERCTSLFGL